MRCKYCGKYIPNEQVVCNFCGCVQTNHRRNNTMQIGKKVIPLSSTPLKKEPIKLYKLVRTRPFSLSVKVKKLCPYIYIKTENGVKIYRPHSRVDLTKWDEVE